MLTPAANWTAKADKKLIDPVFLFEIEKDFYESKLTAAEDWQAGSGGDGAARLGSLIATTTEGDILGATGYTNEGSLTNGVPGYLYARIKPLKDFVFKGLSFEAKSASASDVMTVRLYKILDDIRGTNDYNNGNVYGGYLVSSKTELGLEEVDLTSSYQTFTVTFNVLDPETGTYPYPNGIKLEANATYAIVIHVDYGDTFYFKYWTPDEDVFNQDYGRPQDPTYRNFKGYADGGVEIAQGAMETLRDPSENIVHDVWRPYSESSAYGLFNGNLFIKTFAVEKYDNIIHTSIFKRVYDQQGFSILPTFAGELQVDAHLPDGVTLSVQIYGDADGTPTGQVDLGTKVSGDSVSAYEYYKFVLNMQTTKWWETGEIKSVAVHFGLFEKYVMSDESFGTYLPLIRSIPTLESMIDPIECKGTSEQLQVEIAIRRYGYSLASSYIEDLINGYVLTGQPCRLLLGFKGLAESDYLLIARGWLNDKKVTDETVTLVCKDTIKVGKDPLLIDQSDERISNAFYYYLHPVDIILDLLNSLLASQFIPTSAWAAVKTATSGWKVFRPFPSTTEDKMLLVQELCFLLGYAPVQKEDGKLYPVNLFDESTSAVVTFDSNNSKPLGLAELREEDRINVAEVRREYWDEHTLEEARIKHYDQSINVAAALEVGRNNTKLIDSKWIGRVKVSSQYISKIVAERLTTFFPYGVWSVFRATNYDMAKYQLGDIVNVTTDQIVYKGFSGYVTKRAVIIGKKWVPERFSIEWEFLLIKPNFDTEPTASPSGLSFTSVTTTGMTLNFTKNGDGTIAIRRTVDYPGVSPIDGQTYPVGAILSDGSVVAYVGSSQTPAITGLVEDTKYYWSLHSYKNTAGKINYRTSDKLQGNRFTDSSEPAASPTGAVLTVTGATQINVAWTKAVGSKGTIVVRHATTDVSNNPADKTQYTRGDLLGGVDTIAYMGEGETFIDTGLTNGVTYYYKFYSYNGSEASNYNVRTTSPLSANHVCTVAEPTAQITDFALNVVSSPKRTCYLTWTEESPKATGVLILAKVGSISDSPTDTNVYSVGNTIGSSKVVFVGDSVVEAKTVVDDNYDTFKAFTYNDSASPNYRITGAPQVIES